jgi:hypothetical protein
MSLDSKVERLNKRYRGLARVTSSINDLYIYGIYESNFPKLMEVLNKAKDAVKDEIKATKDEIEYSAGYTIAKEPVTDPLRVNITEIKD